MKYRETCLKRPLKLTTPVYDMGKARSVMNDTALYMVIDTVLDFLQRTRYTTRCEYSIW